MGGRLKMNWRSMNADQASQWAGWLWTVLMGVWLVMWFGIKKAKRRETSRERLQHLIPLLIGSWLLFGRNWGGLNSRLVPDVPAAWWLGLVLTAVGVGISIWARVSLGANWSGVVTLKDDHELIRKGIYRWIRHPIYTGILLAMIGTAMIKGHLRGWVGFLIVLAAFYFKARREESFLRQEFGDGFEEHAKHTGMFLPKFI
jgi:protein-S-isoprenylcysteine O-methyltransferase Ste14